MAALLLMFCFGSASVVSARTYTNEHPLVYEDAWDLWPYVFLNEKGQPEGFNIDLLHMLCSELDIPYVVRLKPTSEALEDLKAGRSDLMLGMAANFHDEYASYGREVVQLFTHSVVSPKSKPVNVRTIGDLARQRVMVHTGSFSHHLMMDRGWAFNSMPFDDMREAVQKVAADDEGQIVWNTQSLKWLMSKYHTSNLQLTPIDIPHGEYRFMANDSVLLHLLDSTYVNLCSTERMVPVLNKWFYPERVDTGIPTWVKYVMGVSVVMLFLLLYYIMVLRLRERQMAHLIDRHNRRLALILRTTKLRVWLYDVKSQTLSWMGTSGWMEPVQHRLQEYADRYDRHTFARLMAALDSVATGKSENSVVELLSNQDSGMLDTIVSLSVFRRTKKGEPAVIVGMMDDQTERLLAQRQAKDNMLRYQTIFSTSMVDMTYYDTEGVLVNINQKACRTFHCNREQLLSERVPFNYALEDPAMTIEDFEGSYTTHIVKAKDNPNLAESINFERDTYYEQQLVPVYDAANRFLGIFGSGRDVTEFVDSYHQLKSSVREMMLAAQDVTDYINNINYALHVGGVRLVNYSPETHILTIYREMNVVQLELTQSRCLSLLDDESRRAAIRLMNNMDLRSDEQLDAEIHTNLQWRHGQTLWLQFHVSPVYDKAGRIESYFGLCRDVSQEKATETELEREKAKAQEVENVKNAFLRNMSYEIRTPITTVVGFAELFAEEHDPADEDSFIREIKQNASYLLKLVNDILLLSRLDAHMIEFKKAPIDFALTFEGHCTMGWGKKQKAGVSYRAVNPYEHLVVEIDDANVGYIIEQLASNAAHYTDSGSVTARYDYIGERLLITIDDTGCGITPEQQKTMFERFATLSDNIGVGLGMPICKELARQMNGAINVNSTPGGGTTVWIEIPCRATQIEKRKANVNTE